MDTSPPDRPTSDLSIFRRLMKVSVHFRSQRLAWGVALLASLVAAATEPLIPAFLKPLLDQGFTQGAMPLWLVPTVLIGLFAVRGLAQFCAQYALARIANEGMVGLRRDLFTRLLDAEMTVFGRHSASALSNTIVYEVQTGASQLVQALLGLSRDGFTLVALLGYLLILNWKLTLIVAVVVPGVAWIMKSLSRRLYRLARSSQTATDELAYVVEENVLAHRMVRLHGAQAMQAGRFNVLSQRLRQLAVKSSIASSAMTPLTQLLSAAALSVVVAVAMWQSQNGRSDDLTVGGFVAFITAMLMLVSPIRRLADVANPITRGLAALERGLELIAEANPETDGDLAPTAVQGAIEFKDIGVSYRDEGAPALSQVNLLIAPGETVALVGPSGSGKTSLVNLLARFVLPSEGQVLLDGQDIAGWQLKALRAQIAMVSQDVVMLNDSVAANVALGQAMDRDRVEHCLAAANLTEHVLALPQGMDTVVGHNATQLSGGQRQRLAIARALYKNAPILILDEATSALDTESERLVQDALQRLMLGRTTLIVAHRLSTIEHADRVVVMAGGQVAEQGSHAQLMAADGLYARLQSRGGLAE